MGWFSSKKEITEFQKAKIVAMAGTFIGEFNPNLENHLSEIRTRIGISENSFNYYIPTLQNLFNNLGVTALEDLKALSKEDRKKIKDIFEYSKLHSNIKNINPDFDFLYNKVLSYL